VTLAAFQTERAHISRRRLEQRSVLCHLQVHAGATVRCAGLQRALVAPRQEMPNLEDPKGGVGGVGRRGCSSVLPPLIVAVPGGV
jgi:hypothetical protein